MSAGSGPILPRQRSAAREARTRRCRRTVPFKETFRNSLSAGGWLKGRHGLSRLTGPRYPREVGKVQQISAAGMRESQVHDVTVTKEAPNYRT